jgi:surface protein
MKIGVLGLSPLSTSLLATIRGTSSGGVPPVNLDFVSTWDTTKAGSASNTVVIPLLSGGTYSGTIDWGDGNSDALSYANRTHVYASSGIYNVTISGTIGGFQFNNGGDKLKITGISNWGTLDITTNRSFLGCKNLDISATDQPILTSTNLSFMFRDCDLSTFNPSNWDVSHITNMSYMFAGLNQTTNQKFNGDISGWDVSSVTNMIGMLSWTALFNQPLNNWDVSNAAIGTSSPVDFGMFQGAKAFNQPLDNWDVSNKTDFAKLFNGATVFNQNLGAWDMSSAINLELMFSGCTAFNNGGSDSINDWDVSNVLTFGVAAGGGGGGIFSSCIVFNQPLNNWDTSSATNMSQMFNNATLFNQDISNWDTSGVTRMSQMFQRASAFNQPIGSWNTSSLLYVDWMFHLDYAFNQDISSWDVNQVILFNTTFMLGVILSTANYDALLIAWDAQGAMSYSGTVNFGGSKYTAGGAAEAARTSLINKWGGITDGGPA